MTPEAHRLFLLSRRHFLLRGLFALGAASVALRWPWGSPSVSAAQPVLGLKHKGAFEAIALAFVPPGGDPPFDAATVQAGARFLEIVTDMPTAIQRALGLLVAVFDRLPYLHGDFTLISSKPLDQRQEAVARVMNSKRAGGRALFIFMKEFVMMSVYSNPAVYGAIGYQPPCHP